MKLRPVGFYREIAHGRLAQGSIHEVLADTACQDEDKIIAFLRSGTMCLYEMCVPRDPISGEYTLGLDSSVYFTDGVYVWKGALADLVERYHVRLPDGFIDHMRRQNWHVPPNCFDMKNDAVEFV